MIAGLRFKPEKIVFVGFKKSITKKKMADLTRFFEMRGLDIAIEYEFVSRVDLASVIETLNRIIDSNDDCCFDLTGGKEPVLVAMGMVCSERNIPMFQFDVRSGDLIRVKNCDDIEDTPKTVMLIEESVALHGGSVVYGDNADPEWELTDDFKKDIRLLWNICKKDCAKWNKQSIFISTLEKYSEYNENHSVCIDLRQLKEKIVLDKRIIKELTQNNLLLDYSLDGDVLSFRFKNEQVYRVITKAGNILELYAYMNLREIARKCPGYYDDIDVGVIIDWDGLIHDGDSVQKDTRNEIDVVLMRDMIPIFISCKNGELHKEALYEINSVAQQFGGEYAKKFVLTTYISKNEKARKYILQRAHDMGIEIIDGVDAMSETEFIEILKNRVK